MEEMPERRRFPRYPCKGPAEILQSGNLVEWGNVSDIGRCGCYVEIRCPLPVGTEVELRVSVAGVALDIYARVICTTAQVGMGMEFMDASQEQENLLAQIIAKVTAIDPAPALPAADRPQPTAAPIRITREAIPELFAKMLKRINEKGVLTKQELVEMVKNH